LRCRGGRRRPTICRYARQNSANICNKPFQQRGFFAQIGQLEFAAPVFVHELSDSQLHVFGRNAIHTATHRAFHQFYSKSFVVANR
jgi:hypothetical protein